MMTLNNILQSELQQELTEVTEAYGELTVECDVVNLRTVLFALRDKQALGFNQLIDVCAVD